MLKKFVLLALFFPLLALADDETKPPSSDLDKAVPPAAEVKTAPVVEKKEAPKEVVFTGAALKIKERMDELFESSKKVNIKGAAGTKARQNIETAMDWEKISRDCLGDAQWKKQSQGNLKAFQNLLKEVVVKTAYSRMDTFWKETTYKFEKIDVKGNTAFVTANFTVKGDAFRLDYYLQKKGAQWFIHDIAFEEMRYSTNINEQLVAFLKEKPFPSLLERLKKRRAELDSPKTEKKPSA